MLCKERKKERKKAGKKEGNKEGKRYKTSRQDARSRVDL